MQFHPIRCEKFPKRRCHTTYKNECTTKQKCRTIQEEKCTRVPKKECKDVKVKMQTFLMKLSNFHLGNLIPPPPMDAHSVSRNKIPPGPEDMDNASTKCLVKIKGYTEYN